MEDIKKDMKKIEKLLDELKQTRLNQHEICSFLEEEYELNIRCVNETKEMQMIVDSGAPISITTTKWMDRYLKSMEVKEKRSLRKFVIEGLRWVRMFT